MKRLASLLLLLSASLAHGTERPSVGFYTIWQDGGSEETLLPSKDLFYVDSNSTIWRIEPHRHFDVTGRLGEFREGGEFQARSEDLDQIDDLTLKRWLLKAEYPKTRFKSQLTDKQKRKLLHLLVFGPKQRIYRYRVSRHIRIFPKESESTDLVLLKLELGQAQDPYYHKEGSELTLSEHQERIRVLAEYPSYFEFYNEAIFRSDPELLHWMAYTEQPRDFFMRHFGKDDGLAARLAQRLLRIGYFNNGLEMEFVSEDPCVKYPPEKLRFERYQDLSFDLAADKLKAVPRALAHHFFSGALANSPGEYEEICQEVKSQVSDRAFDLSTAILPEILELSSDIVGSRIDYALVDEDPQYQHLSIRNSSSRRYATYWNGGFGDCDKYASLNELVFSCLKALAPQRLQNIYLLSHSLMFGHDIDHAWNTVAIFGENELTFTYVDPTYRDAGRSYNALWHKYFDKRKFRSLYSGVLCGQTERVNEEVFGRLLDVHSRKGQ